MKKTSILLLSIIMSACSSPVKITEGAKNIQVLKGSNVTASTCKKLGPVNATIEKARPAQVVSEATVWEARNKASLMGADSLMILNKDYSNSGIVNIVTVQGVALKCY